MDLGICGWIGDAPLYQGVPEEEEQLINQKMN